MGAIGILGYGIYVGVIVAGTLWLIRHGKQHGIFWPVILALSLRLVVMLATHFVSIAHGHGGFFFADDRDYHEIGRRLSHEWRSGHAADPTAAAYAGSLQAGFSVLVALVYTLVGGHAIALKLINALLGAAVVAPASALGERLGAHVKKPTAWLVAVCPTLVWWSATGLKEPLVDFLFVATLALGLELRSMRMVSAFSALVIALALTRLSAAAAVAATLVVVGIFQPRRREQAKRSVVSLLSLLPAFALLLVALGHGNPAHPLRQYWKSASSLLGHYQGDDPGTIVTAFARTLVSPYPWVFDAATESWYRALYPGMWMWYALLPLAAVGAWRLRDRVTTRAIVLLTACVLLVNAVLIGTSFRQRSVVEPLLVVLAAAGVTSWAYATRVAGAALVAVAVFAGVQTRALESHHESLDIAPSFSTGATAWSPTAEGVKLRTGQGSRGSLTLSVSTAGLTPNQGLVSKTETPITPSRHYVVSFRVRAQKGTRVLLWADLHDGRRRVVDSAQRYFLADGAFRTEPLHFTAPGNAVTTRLFVLSSGSAIQSGSQFMIDGVKFKELPLTTFLDPIETGGLIATAGAFLLAISGWLGGGRTRRRPTAKIAAFLTHRTRVRQLQDDQSVDETRLATHSSELP
jgi:hypothetical protein